MSGIVVNNLGKAYKRYPTRWARLAEWALPWSEPRHQLNWVLRDINFSVNPGEAVGIIGINGAGKSTLLKIVTGTIQPTSGSVQVTGRVAALLELGMGFHPDFTGRQNAVMAGQLLGYSVEEIVALMPHIEAFAAIGDYIDQPTRVYSSGMQMRLAFSVATANRPDILVVDEALSVGDAYFQHKSFDRIREFRKQGTTLLFVSHDKQAIQTICDRVVLLNAGELLMEGNPEAVMDYYNGMLTAQPVVQKITEQGRVKTVSGTGEASLVNVSLLNINNQEIVTVIVGQQISLKIIAIINNDIERLVVGFMIKDRLGQPIFGTNTRLLKSRIGDMHSGQELECYFDFQANIFQGNYSISVSLHSEAGYMTNNYQWNDLALIFDVVNITETTFIGTWIPTTCRLEKRTARK